MKLDPLQIVVEKDAINKAMGIQINIINLPSYILQAIKILFPNGIEYTKGSTPSVNGVQNNFNANNDNSDENEKKEYQDKIWRESHQGL